MNIRNVFFVLFLSAPGLSAMVHSQEPAKTARVNAIRQQLIDKAVLGKFDEVFAILKQTHIDPASIITKDGNTLLHYAAMRGDLACVEQLVKAGFPVHKKKYSWFNSIEFSSCGWQCECG